jgi:hypothetical protein
VAFFHFHEIPDVSGGMLGAFGVTAPGSVSFSCLFKEIIHDLPGVVLLVSHLILHVMSNLMFHVTHSVLDVVHGVSHFMSVMSSLSMIMQLSAIGFSGALVMEVVSNMSNLVH